MRALGTVRVITESSHSPITRFHPGIAAMYARTGVSPSAFATCGLPPDKRLTGSAFADFRDGVRAFTFTYPLLLLVARTGISLRLTTLKYAACEWSKPVIKPRLSQRIRC